MSENSQRLGRATNLLSELVRINSVNPMGRRYPGSHSVEHHVIQLIEGLFADHSGRVSLERQSCSEFHQNLVVSLGNHHGGPVALFESHMDTVPADDWTDRALNPVVHEGTLVGRGACDDKGSLAAMVIALLEILEDGIEPPIPIVLLCAGDEEFAQTGIRHYVQGPHPDLAYAIFGEPTQLHPIIQHKGTVRWDITVHGSSAHSSRPELGSNAILGAMDVIAALQSYQNRLQAPWRSPYMSGPTVTVTMIDGGRTRNAIADTCELAVDFRVLPNMDPASEREALIEYLNSLGWPVSHGPVQLMTPALNSDPKLPICQEVLGICQDVVSSRVVLRGEPYGTDAAWVSELCPAIVLGPGDIRHAHAIDEQIALSELIQGIDVYKRIMLHQFETLNEFKLTASADLQQPYAGFLDDATP